MNNLLTEDDSVKIHKILFSEIKNDKSSLDAT